MVSSHQSKTTTRQRQKMANLRIPMMPFTGPATTRQTWSDNGKTTTRQNEVEPGSFVVLSDGCRTGEGKAAEMACRLPASPTRRGEVLQETVSAFPSPTREFCLSLSCLAGLTFSHSVNTLPAIKTSLSCRCLVVVLLWCENTISMTYYVVSLLGNYSPWLPIGASAIARTSGRQS